MNNVKITINGVDYNAINDWKAFPRRYSLGDAEPMIDKVKVPYRNGRLNISKWAGNKVFYDNRKIVVEMLLAGEAPIIEHSSINTLLNGKEAKITFSDDEEYYYKGTFSVGKLDTRETQWRFDLIIDAEPYKYKQNPTIIEHTFTNEPWNFTLNNECMETYPIIRTTSSTLLSGRINGTDISINTSGTHALKDITLIQGSNTGMLQMNSGNTITITYQEGKL